MSKLAELSIALLSFYSLSFFFSLSPHKGCIREAAKRHFLRGEGKNTLFAASLTVMILPGSYPQENFIFAINI